MKNKMVIKQNRFTKDKERLTITMSYARNSNAVFQNATSNIIYKKHSQRRKEKGNTNKRVSERNSVAIPTELRTAIAAKRQSLPQSARNALAHGFAFLTATGRIFFLFKIRLYTTISHFIAVSCVSPVTITLDNIFYYVAMSIKLYFRIS